MQRLSCLEHLTDLLFQRYFWSKARPRGVLHQAVAVRLVGHGDEHRRVSLKQVRVVGEKAAASGDDASSFDAGEGVALLFSEAADILLHPITYGPPCRLRYHRIEIDSRPAYPLCKKWEQAGLSRGAVPDEDDVTSGRERAADERANHAGSQPNARVDLPADLGEERVTT